MPNGTYGGVRGRKTKVGRKLLRFPPTRFYSIRLISDGYILPFTSTPSDTAGLRCAPDICPTPYAIATTVRPKARETPKNPTLPPAKTAVPQPPNTRVNVPINSANALFVSFIIPILKSYISSNVEKFDKYYKYIH